MFKEEALWIADILSRQTPPCKGLVMDVGSCTEEYRCVGQPFIDYYIFKPLRERGCQVVYADAQAAKGVDLVFDFAAEAGDEKKLADYWGRCDVVICANLLEHVENRDAVLKRLKKLLAPEGLLILTAPNQYRYHPHPIDTLYRPSQQELEGLFESGRFLCVASCILEVEGEAVLVPFSLGQRVQNRLRRILGFEPLKPVFIRNKVVMAAMRQKKGAL